MFKTSYFLLFLVIGILLSFGWAYSYSEKTRVANSVQNNIQGRSYESYTDALTNPWNVRELQVPYNDVIGAEIGAFINLESLEFSWYEEGPIPLEIFQLKKLKKIIIHTGQDFMLPSQIANLGLLEELTIESSYSIESSKSIPAELGNLKNLRRLILSTGKKFKFQFSISKLTGLEEISLGGLLPKEADAIQGLKKIDVYQIETGCNFTKLSQLSTLKIAVLDTQILNSSLSVEEFWLQPRDSFSASTARALPVSFLNWKKLKIASIDLHGDASQISSSVSILSRIPLLEDLTFSQEIVDSSKIIIASADNYFPLLKKLNVYCTPVNYKIFHRCTSLQNLSVGLVGAFLRENDSNAEDLTFGLSGIRTLSIQFLNPVAGKLLQIKMNSLSKLKELTSLHISGMGVDSFDSTFSWMWLGSIAKLEELTFERCGVLNANNVWNEIEKLHQVRGLSFEGCEWYCTTKIQPRSTSITTLTWIQNSGECVFNWSTVPAVRYLNTDELNYETFSGLKTHLDSITYRTYPEFYTSEADELEIIRSFAPAKMSFVRNGPLTLEDQIIFNSGFQIWEPFKAKFVEGESQQASITWFPSGMKKQVLYYTIDSLHPDLIETWYESGSVESKTNFIYDSTRTKVIYSYQTKWLENGNLSAVVSRNEDKLDGMQMMFYPSGRVYMIQYFNKGKKSDVWQTWNEKGELKEKSYGSR